MEMTHCAVQLREATTLPRAFSRMESKATRSDLQCNHHLLAASCTAPGFALRAGGEIVGDLILRAELTPLRNGGINKSFLFLNNFFVAEFSEIFLT